MTEEERKIAVILAQAQMDKDAAQGGGIPSGLNPQMTRPVKSSFMNPADYADEPKSSMRQMIDDARSGKRDDIPALLMAGIENVGTMPLKMMTLEGMHGLTQDIARAIATPYNVLTSPEPVTTEQMIEPAANIALTAPLGGMAVGRMAPVERVAYSNSKEGALPGILSGAGQKQGTSATAGHPSGSGVPSLPPSDPMAGGLPGHTPSSGQPGQGGHTSLPRDPSLDAWRNSVIQDIAKRIEDADLRLDDIGLRAETGRTFKDGEYLPKSRVWDDGAPLNEELNGTSTIGLDRYTTTPEDVAGALHGLGNYEGDSLVLVGGRGKEFGVDSGEHVIRNAQSLGQWPRYKDGMQLFSNSKEAAPLSLLSQGKEEVRGLRLYRGEGANPNDKIGGGLDWSGGIGDAARGNWFTTSLDEAKGTYAGKDGKVYYVDVPHDRMGDLTNSVLFPAEHYVVPGDIAAKKQLHEALSQGKDTPQGDNTPMIARIARLLSSR